MPSTTRKPVPFASATAVSTADELIDKLIALRPIQEVTLETTIGTSDATECQIIEVTGSGQSIDHGTRPIFWTVIRRQLTRATPEVPWIAGTLTKSGQAFTLAPLDEQDAARVQRALSTVST